MRIKQGDRVQIEHGYDEFCLTVPDASHHAAANGLLGTVDDWYNDQDYERCFRVRELDRYTIYWVPARYVKLLTERDAP